METIFQKGIALDGEGNVYVTGISQRTSFFSDYDYATIKYDSVGQEQWVARYNGPGNAYEQVSGLAVDGLGNVFVTGRSGSGFDDDYVTIKYEQGPRQTQYPVVRRGNNLSEGSAGTSTLAARRSGY